MPDFAQYDPIFEEAGREWDVDPRLLKAMATQESGGDPRARSKANAQGLMQIVPGTQKYLGVTDPHDPTQSIWGGAKYMAEALTAEKTPEDALRYYHGGAGWRSSYGPESKAYAPAVTAHYVRLAKATPAAEPPVGAAARTGGTDMAGPGVPAASEPTGTAPVANTDAHADFLKRTGAGGDATDDDAHAGFLARTGAVPAPSAPEPPPQPGVESGSALDTLNRAVTSVGANPRAASSQPLANVLASPEALAGDMSQSQAPGPPVTAANVNALLAPAPNTTYGESPIVPLARDNTTGQIRLAMPSSIRSLLQGGADLLQGPGGMVMSPNGTPMLSPDATGALATVAGIRSPAAGTGKLIAGAEDAALRARVAALPAPEPPAPILSPEFQASPLAPGAAERIAAAPDAAGPNLLDPDAPPVAAAPRSVGSAASREGTPAGAIDMTPEQAAAAKTTADVQWLNKTNQPGVADPNEYIPGITPTMAQREQTVQTAREQKTLRNLSEDVSQEERAVLDDHNQKRSDYYSETAGSEVTRANAAKVRDDKMDTALAAAWRNKGSADAQPIVQLADEIKASADGRRPVVRNAVDRVTAELFDANGKLITDPELLYGVRKHINDMLSKEAARDDPVSQRAAGHLISLRDAVDGVIEPAAPGFKAAISNYAKESGPIDAAAALQARESKLYDTQGRMQFSKVHALLRDVIEAQRPDAALSPWQHLTEGQMTRLKALHDDLKRAASAEDLARAYGSDTAQNAVDAIKEYGKMAATAGAHGVANVISPGLGSIAVSGVRNMLAPIFAARTARKQTERGMQMLHPDPAKYPTRNLLEPPT